MNLLVKLSLVKVEYFMINLKEMSIAGLDPATSALLNVVYKHIVI